MAATTTARVLLCLGLFTLAPTLADAAIRIVAAENFYGDVAQQIAGPDAQVTSVLRNPNADPHLFEADVATARALAEANVVIYNGAAYDSWMTRLLSISRGDRHVIEVAELMRRLAPPDNPHFWYDPATMPAVAVALAAQLQQLDPAHAQAYQQRLRQFLESLRPLQLRIAQLRREYGGQAITATEPIANDLSAALGLTMRNQGFQLAIMNNTEPGARETATFEQSLRHRDVRLLIYNRQATGSAVERLLQVARQARIPIVSITETEPQGLDYQQWMLQELDALARALTGSA